MKQVMPRLLVVLVILAIFGGGGWYIEAQRAQQRSVLSGFFESQPTHVSSRVAGRVTRLLVREGDSVHEGQVLLELDATPVQEETAARKAAAEQAQQQLEEVQNGPRLEDIRRQEAAVAEAGAHLARLRAGARPQEIEQAQAAERVARARLAQARRGLTPEERSEVKAQLDAAVAQESFTVKEAERAQRLYDDGAVSRQQLDRAQTALDQARAASQGLEAAWKRAQEGTPAEEMEQAQQAHRQAKAALDLVMAGSRSEDIRAAEARLAQAQAALVLLQTGTRPEQIAQAQAATVAARATARGSAMVLADRIVRAPRNGVVQSIPVAVGDLVGVGTPVVRLDDPNDLWLRVFVPESELANIPPKSDATLKVDGIDNPIAGFVESVATSGEFTPANLQTPGERGKQVFGVRIRLRHTDPRIRSGMYATVEQIGRWTP